MRHSDNCAICGAESIGSFEGLYFCERHMPWGLIDAKISQVKTNRYNGVDYHGEHFCTEAQIMEEARR